MVFSSLLFIFIFLPMALFIFYFSALITQQNKKILWPVLTILSLVFYFWGSGQMIILLIISILLNWLIGNLIITLNSLVAKKIILAIAISVNLASLFYFKYCRFFLDALALCTGISVAPNIQPYLPVGISFYTFMAISYLIDLYRTQKNRATFLEFSLYLCLFPHLVAGPIVRFNEIADNLRQNKALTINNFYNGIIRFTQGLGMKVLLADNLSPFVDHIFSLSQSELQCPSAWLGAIAYTFQIYFDFAGYSSMAIGLALMFGFHFPENFNKPYTATSITNFWKRWHMSLSRWLRDYLYIPLGGNQKGQISTYVNLFTVFFVCGLWHGAAWTFIIWGLYQGAWLIFERVMKNKFNYEPSGISGIASTFFLTMIGWVIFRAESLTQCGYYLKTMFFLGNTSNIPLHSTIELTDPLLLITLAIAILFSFFPIEKFLNKAQLHGNTLVFGKSMLTIMTLLLTSLYAIANTFNPFIYFRF